MSASSGAPQHIPSIAEYAHLLEKIASSANLARSIDEAFGVAIREICRQTGWAVGHAVLINESGVMVSSDIWHLEDSEEARSFREEERNLAVDPEQTISGRVVTSQQPVWVEDLTQELALPRSIIARRTGIHAALAFPVLSEKNIVAVLEFFSRQAIPRNAELVDMMTHVGMQLGRVFERERSGHALRSSELRYRSLAEHAPDAIITTDAEARIDSWNPAAEELFGHAAKDIIGRSILEIFPANYRDAYEQEMRRLTPRQAGAIRGKSFEASVLAKDSREIPVELSLSCWALEGNTYFTAMMHDNSERKGVQEEILRAKNFSELVIACSIDGIFAYDRELRFTAWNPEMERITGIPRAQALGQNAFAVFPFLRDTGEARFFFEALAGRSGLSDSDLGKLVAGKHGFYEGHYAPILDDHRKVVGGVAVVRNVTERKKISELRQRLVEVGQKLAESLDYDRILDSFAESLVPQLATWCVIRIGAPPDKDFRLVVRHADRELEVAVRALNYFQPGDSRNRPLLKSIRSEKPELLSQVPSSLMSLLESDASEADLIHKIGFGSYASIPLQLRGVVVGSVTVVSVERTYEEADLNLFRELSARLGIAVDNARLFSKAERALEMREEFMAIVSHDLKNPLSSILLNAQLLRRGTDVVRVADNLESSHRRMERLIRDFLDQAALESAQFAVDRRPWKPETLVEDAIEIMRPLAEEKGIRLARNVDPSLPEVACDAERVYQVFSNLIGNAIKFTPEGGTITLSAALTPRDEQVVFRVTDTGVGIPQQSLGKVFEWYWHGPQPAEKKGRGLGLSISRAVVEAHGGRIWLTSSPGEGTTVYFTLTRAKPSAASSRAA